MKVTKMETGDDGRVRGQREREEVKRLDESMADVRLFPPSREN